jgi:hypothetical protein
MAQAPLMDMTIPKLMDNLKGVVPILLKQLIIKGINEVSRRIIIILWKQHDPLDGYGCCL